MKDVRIKNILCKVSFEEEFNISDHMLVCFHNKWGAFLELKLEARTKDGVGGKLLDSDCSDFGKRIGGDEQTLQFLVVMEESPKEPH